tara:strand:- start:1531 stop:2925 length:1395 start_codon:yes stop_codon:yes gene_type:complete
MSDVLITPASSKIEFKDASSNIDGTVKLDSDGNLELTSNNGISFGDTSSDIFIGNGTDNVDLKFEADGSITGTSGVTLTLGSSNSNVKITSNELSINATSGIITASSLVADTLKSNDNVVMLTTKPGGSTTNVAIGRSALEDITTAVECVAIGEEALSSYTEDANNIEGQIAIGYRAMKKFTIENSNGGTDGSGSGHNIAIGKLALSENVKTNGHIAIGYGALWQLNKDRTTSGESNGANNIAIGYLALRGTLGTNTFRGSYNIGIGWVAGQNLSHGAQYNTIIGPANTGSTLGDADNNLLLGYQAGGSSSPSGMLSNSNNNVVLGNNSISNSYIKVDWTVTSDKRDKTDIESFTHGLSWINKLNPVTYRWDMRSNYEDGIPDGSKKESKLNVGLIAQEELEVEKEHGYANTSDDMLISHINPGGSYGMQYSKLVPVLINAVKELSAKNDALEARIKALESGGS